MIPNETPQSIETVGQGVKVVGNFRITDATQARILVSLSDKMYTKKELAFVREYSTNAADAHIVAKKPISEIVVELPTMENLNFRIRDFGSGLTEEQIATVYCVFGESTKRNSNEQNGLLGYGCKAGFAHADSFTVTSWVGGEKSIYQCVKGDSSKLHSALLLSRSASDEPTGIEIKIPVKQNSIWTVHREASNFYKHWPEMPTILNMVDNDKERMDKFRSNPPTLKGEGWEIRPKSDSNATGVAYMGWVAYAIDWNVLSNRMSLTSQKRVLFELLQSNDVTLFYKMGDIQFVDSRESLEYTDLTLDALMKRIEGIFTKIKDAIQEKFDPAPNLWEAKKFYNAIFGTGLVEAESGEDDVKDTVERIRILDGNLMRLESSFQGSFLWNGIVLSNPYFDGINKFDNAYPTEIRNDHRDPLTPVMVTYRKKKKRAKINRCTNEKNNRIVASDSVAIVINDTGLKTGQSVVSRYLIFRQDSRIRTVHVLTFVDDTIKDNFYSEYNFETVPVLKLSELLPDAKVWNAANKVSRSYGGGGGGARPMRYMDIESKGVLENEVPIRDMEDGGYYIEAGEGRRSARRVVSANQYQMEDPHSLVGHMATLVEKGGLELDRVFIISKQTKESKWFKEAKASGDWINIWDYLKEAVAGLDVVPLVDSINYESDTVVCPENAEKIKDKISDKNSPMLKLIATCSAKNYSENLELAEALRELGLWKDLVGETKGTTDFEAMKETMNRQYPMLVDHYGHILCTESYLRDDVLAKVIRYINAMDLYVDLGGDELPLAEPKQAEEQTA